MEEQSKIKDLLRERARHLASVREDKKADKRNKMKALLFNLGYEKYAIDSIYVSEVIFIKEITPLPCTPDFLLGIINIRGKIISVIDIRVFFGLKNKGISNLNRVIVVSHNGIEFGILTDVIEGQNTVNIDSLQKNITSITEVPDNYILGVTTNNLIVLDIQKLINSDRIIIDEKVK